MAGLADILFGTPANTGTGSQSANQNGPSASTLQAAAPFIGNGFSLGMPANGLFTTAPQPTQNSFAQLLQSLMSAKAEPSPPDTNGFNSPYQPSADQAARIQQLAATFPQSRNVVDVRQTPQFYPQQPLPIQGMMQGAMQGIQANPYWPRPNPGPQQRYGPQ
jgi:hypothetical protein